MSYTSDYEPPIYAIKPHECDILFRYLTVKNNQTKMKVFLGGTCNESKWRDDLIKMLKIDYFNPVVDDWNESAYREELHQRNICDFVLYVITPKMTGVYSIAEVVDDSNKRPQKTIFCILENDESYTFTKSQLKSLLAVAEMVKNNGGKYFTDLRYVAEFLNKYV